MASLVNQIINVFWYDRIMFSRESELAVIRCSAKPKLLGLAEHLPGLSPIESTQSSMLESGEN